MYYVYISPHLSTHHAGERMVTHQPTADTLILHANPEHMGFTFDHVAPPSATQEHMFKVVGRPIVDNCVAGFNSTIFAYGEMSLRGEGEMGRANRSMQSWPPRMPSHSSIRPSGAARLLEHPCMHIFASECGAGQTGSGKTHTMLGSIPEPGAPFTPEAGLIPRIFSRLFDRIGEVEAQKV
jgi:hypothetical protein